MLLTLSYAFMRFHMLSYVLIRFHTLLNALKCYLFAMGATYLFYKHKVSPEEEEADRGSRVYRLYLRKPVKKVVSRLEILKKDEDCQK